MIEIARGAEAVLFQDGDRIIKERVAKAYRHPHIDAALRGQRTRREAKVMQRLASANIPCPALIDSNDKDMRISMAKLDGNKLRDVLTTAGSALGRRIGELIGKTHAAGIIHGDLTTSNMILGDELNLIDFGLSHFSTSAEDRAVDLNVLWQTLNSTHADCAQAGWDAVIAGYRAVNPEAESVIARLEKVQGRGRNKSSQS